MLFNSFLVNIKMLIPEASKILLDRSCRICLIEPKGDEIYGSIDNVTDDDLCITDDNFKNQPAIKYVDMLCSLTSGLYRYGYGSSSHPRTICASCQETLQIAYKFQEMCLRTERMLNDVTALQEFVSSSKIVATVQPSGVAVEMDSFTEIAPNNDGVIDDLLINNESNVKEEFLDITFLDTDDTIDDDEEEIEIIDGHDICVLSDAEQEESSLTLPLSNAFLDNEIKCSDDDLNGYVDDTEVSRPILARKKSTTRRCRQCAMQFADYSAYQVHYRQVHQPHTLCTQCGKLVAPNAMEKHVRCHTSNKTFQCLLCSKSFKLSENLKKHERIHTGDKRYTCEHCGEKFVHWNSKRSHVRTKHTGEKK